MSELNGTTAIVTGANSGIGYVTAETLARQGATVILMCRNPDKGQTAVESIASHTGCRPELIVCDFSKPQDIEWAAPEFQAKHQNLQL